MHPVYRKLILIIIVLFMLMFFLLRYVFSDGQAIMLPDKQRLASNAPLIVSVFYEALCSDSKHFILKQLLPTFNRASEVMDVHLVPYGKATTMTNADGTYQFNCQHGPDECSANKYHACTILAIENAQTRLDMIACMIKDNRMPREALQRCIKQHGLEEAAVEIQKCYDSVRGDELLAINGKETHALRPKITFIPTITLDGAQGHQASILKDLFGEICKIVGHTDKATEICQKHKT